MAKKKQDLEKQNVIIRVKTERFETGEHLFDSDVLMNQSGGVSDTIDEPGHNNNEPEVLEIFSEGQLYIQDGRVVLSYEESELTGMEGSTTEISYRTETPGLVTMYRSGTVSTSLVFELGRRHHCVYETPFMPFDVCVHTLKVRNNLLTDGRMNLDYIIEIRGAQAEHCRMSLVIHKNVNQPTTTCDI